MIDDIPPPRYIYMCALLVEMEDYSHLHILSKKDLKAFLFVQPFTY